MAAVWFNLKIDSTDDLTSADACRETKAGVLFFRLLVTDLLSALLVMLVVRPLLYKIPESKKYPFLPFGKKATFDLPDEMMKLVYRQALTWVGSMFMPVMFIWGTFQAGGLYFVTFASLYAFHKPPEKPFGATRAAEFFLWVLFFALLFSCVPFALYLSADTNLKCGPLRHYTCAPVNTTCGADTFDFVCPTQRTNIEGVESFFPKEYIAIASNSSLTTAERLTKCNNNVRCWIQVGLTALFSRAALAVVTLGLFLANYFSYVRLKRVTNQLRATNKTLQEEHHDKILLIRNLGIDMD